MKTLILTTLILFLHTNLSAQQYAIASNYYNADYFEIASTSTFNIASVSTYKIFTNEVTNEVNFDYKKFRSSSKKTNITYLIGSRKYDKSALSKIFRKAARKSENTKEFANYLKTINKNLITELTETELQLLFKKFRSETFYQYLDDFRAAI